MLAARNVPGLTLYWRRCDVAGCTARVSVEQWPGGAVESGGFLGAVGPREGRARTRYDVCPACAAAGKLPPRAQAPQPWPLSA